MNFLEFWHKLQAGLRTGVRVKNWTAKRGYLGDEFGISAVSDAAVDIDSPNAENVQRVPKKDFEILFSNWEAYCSGKLQRQELREMTRFSKYTMSIIKHIQDTPT